MKGDIVIKKKRKFFNAVELLTFILILLSTQMGVSQTDPDNNSSEIVDNVNYSVADDKVIVTYDLLGDPDQLYKVSLILRRTSSKDVMYIPKTVSGDIGEGHYSGKGKRIVWNIKEDFPGGLSGQDFYFMIRAVKIESGPDILLWTGIGVAAVAAVATYLIVGSESGSDSGNSSGSFPLPPGRP